MNNRNTIQRLLVHEAVKELQCHPTADEVYGEIIKKYTNISRGTVYRNLNLLSEMGVIRKLEIPNGADCFDHQCHGHYHVKCEKCGGVFDVDMMFMTDLEKNINDSRGFRFIGHDIIFKGICPDCNK